MPKETRRFLTKLQMPPPGFGSTSQMWFKAFWSCTKTPVAPNRMVTRPMIVASTPEPWLAGVGDHGLDRLRRPAARRRP